MHGINRKRVMYKLLCVTPIENTGMQSEISKVLSAMQNAAFNRTSAMKSVHAGMYRSLVAQVGAPVAEALESVVPEAAGAPVAEFRAIEAQAAIIVMIFQIIASLVTLV